MKKIFTIGFAKKTLEEFVSILQKNKITKVVDIRLNRSSQLSGFAKEKDLRFIVEKVIGISYEVMPQLAPTEKLLSDYRENKDWESYELKFRELIKERHVENLKDRVLADDESICLLCSEESAEKCHRRLVAEFFGSLEKNILIEHL